MSKKFVQTLQNHFKHSSSLQQAALLKTEQRLGRKLSSDSVQANASDPVDINIQTRIVDVFQKLPSKHQTEVTNFLTHQLQFKQLLDKYATVEEDNLDRVEHTANRVGLDAAHLNNIKK